MKNRKLNSKRFDSVDSFSRASKTDVVHSARKRHDLARLFHSGIFQISAYSLTVTVGFGAWFYGEGASAIGIFNIASDPNVVESRVIADSLSSFCQSGFIEVESSSASFTGYKLASNGSFIATVRFDFAPLASERKLNANLSLSNSAGNYPFSSGSVTKTYSYGYTFSDTDPSLSLTPSSGPNASGLIVLPINVSSNASFAKVKFKILLSANTSSFKTAVYDQLADGNSGFKYSLSANAAWEN